jgi:hypothetical protein
MLRGVSFVVPARFNGPPESGNGGWVSGHASRLVATSHSLPAVTVRLRTPPPLERPLQVTTSSDGSVTVADGDHAVLEAAAAPGPDGHGIPDVVPFADAQAAGASYEGLTDHPFPTCFSCGTARDPDDALCLQPAAVPGAHGAYACAWVPAHDVDLETVWAALDCPGGWASGVARRPMVLGTMTGQVRELPAPGEAHVVMAWQRGAEGRKHFSGTALYAPDGTLLAQAEATWIAIDPTTVRPARGAEAHVSHLTSGQMSRFTGMSFSG